MELHIKKLGPHGDAAAPSGRSGLIWVSRAMPGEIVEGRVEKDRQGTARAEISRLVRPSKERVEAPCPHYEECGGCTLQHVSEKFYKDWKTSVVKEALTEQKVFVRSFLPTQFLDLTHNRRRATFSLFKNHGNLTMGYYERRGHHVNQIDECLICDPQLFHIRDGLKPQLMTLLYDKKPVDLFIQLGDNGAEIILTGAVMKNRLHETFKNSPLNRVCWRQTANDDLHQVYSRAHLTKKFGELEVHLPPGSFLQPTEAGEKAITQAVLSALPAGRKVADLFCGSGTFSGPLLERFTQVDAYEANHHAVKALTQAAKEKPLHVFKRDLFKSPLRKELNRYDAIVVDPPRAGCREQVLQIARSSVPYVVYVSCNPVAFARDAKILTNGGYRVQSVQTIDQFLFSHHVEVVGVFRKG